MKTKLISWTMAAALAALIAVPALAGPNPKPAQAAPPAGHRGGEMAKHPRLHEAMRSLEVAKKHLEAAPHDFGGHRVKAIEHIDQAMEEVRAALKYAEEHRE